MITTSLVPIVAMFTGETSGKGRGSDNHKEYVLNRTHLLSDYCEFSDVQQVDNMVTAFGGPLGWVSKLVFT